MSDRRSLPQDSAHVLRSAYHPRYLGSLDRYCGVEIQSVTPDCFDRHAAKQECGTLQNKPADRRLFCGQLIKRFMHLMNIILILLEACSLTVCISLRKGCHREQPHAAHRRCGAGLVSVCVALYYVIQAAPILLFRSRLPGVDTPSHSCRSRNCLAKISDMAVNSVHPHRAAGVAHAAVLEGPAKGGVPTSSLRPTKVGMGNGK